MKLLGAHLRRGLVAVPLDDPGLVVAVPEGEHRRSSSTVSKLRSHNRFSLSVRMKRSAQPFPSGARTKAGELVMPRKASSVWKWSDRYWLP